jgi:uroporphyrinogen decarboxylase
MKSKERVRNALTRSTLPDRVPLQFDLCRSLLEGFSAVYEIPVDYTTSYYEDVTYRISGNALRTAMGSDCVVVGGGLPAGYTHPRTAEGDIVNEFGMVMRQGPLYMEVVAAPLADVTSAAEVAAFDFPDPHAPGRFADAEAQVAEYRDDYFIIGDLELTLFEMAWHMVGMETFMVDLAMGESYVPALLDRVKAFTIGVGEALTALGVDAIWMGDDFGTQTGLMISPRMWRRIFKPRYREIIEALRSVNPEVIVAFHSDGAVAPLLGDLIEIGVDVFNPVQPNVPGHEPDALKREFGNDLAFWGAIDQQHLLPNGTPQAIETDVAEKIGVLGDGGGYLCAPAHIIQADTSMAHVNAFIAAVKANGMYG